VSQRPSFRDIAPPLDVDDGALRKLADHMDVPVTRRPSDRPAINDPQKVQHAPAPQLPRPLPAPTANDAPAVKQTAPMPTPVPDRTALEKLTVELPGYLMDAIKRDAIDRHTTARHVLLLALQSAGFLVEPADLVPYAPRRKAAKP
jgi:hypothetical protein